MYIRSPLNYVGGKYKLLPKLLDIFPNKIDTFVDLFCGGMNVSANVNSKKTICNDINQYIINLYKYFYTTPINVIYKRIIQEIESLNLSSTNEEAYNTLRKRYNNTKDDIDFFLLICHSFNNIIRFNMKQEFNASFGKNRSSFNSSIKENLFSFIECIQSKDITFYSKQFYDLPLDLSSNDLVYCDPPYLISTATYNEKSGISEKWNEEQEIKLLNYLTTLSNNKVKFVLSNVIEHKNMKNRLLMEWSKDYNTLYVEKSYKNCNYHLRNPHCKTQEVIITNYEPPQLQII